MAKKARAKGRTKAEPAGSPFFRPFAGLERRARESGPEKAPPRAPKPAPAPPRAAAEPDPGGDADTFAIYMAGVRALDGKAERIPLTASQLERVDAPPRLGDPDAVARARMGSLVAEGIRFEVSDDGERVEGRRIDVDPRELRRLRRGQYAVDGKLDLHGMSAADARSAVEAFVRKRRTDGDRVVVIVHGKGTHSPRGIAVLRGEIGAWLSQGRAARDVAAFTSAGPVEDGRPGAVYVLLAR